MDLKIAARMFAVLTLGVGLTAAIATLRDEDSAKDGSGNAPSQRFLHPGGEPVGAPTKRSELVRCRDLGTAALEDAACRKAWAENRRRFFGRARPEQPAMPKPERFGAMPPETGTVENDAPAKVQGRLPSEAEEDSADSSEGEQR